MGRGRRIITRSNPSYQNPTPTWIGYNKELVKQKTLQARTTQSNPQLEEGSSTSNPYFMPKHNSNNSPTPAKDTNQERNTEKTDQNLQMPHHSTETQNQARIQLQKASQTMANSNNPEDPQTEAPKTTPQPTVTIPPAMEVKEVNTSAYNNTGSNSKRIPKPKERLDTAKIKDN